MIQRWNILHLPKRTDRKALSLANAERLEVPKGIVQFWYGKDDKDFRDVEAILDAIVADGFLWFSKMTRPYEEINPGRLCQTWNVCRFLRKLSAESDAIEVLIHDGILLKGFPNFILNFYPDFLWFCDVIAKCCKQRATFKMLTIGDIYLENELKPLEPGSLILKGLACAWNSVRIYSSKGAEFVLQEIEKQVKRNIYQVDDIFMSDDKKTCRSFPGFYTLMLDCIVYDMPREYLGSDSMGWKSYTGAYKEIFSQKTDK